MAMVDAIVFERQLSATIDAAWKCISISMRTVYDLFQLRLRLFKSATNL